MSNLHINPQQNNLIHPEQYGVNVHAILPEKNLSPLQEMIKDQYTPSETLLQAQQYVVSKYLINPPEDSGYFEEILHFRQTENKVIPETLAINSHTTVA